MTIFEKIINREIPSKILYENDKYISFYDINPKRPGHFLVVPKKLSINLLDITDEDYIELMIQAKKWAQQAIKEMGVSGYTLLINNGKEAGQEVFHTHVHIIPSSK